MSTIEEQLALEREMFQLGADRHAFVNNRRQERGMESLSQYGEALTELGIKPLVQVIRDTRRRMKEGKAGPGYAHMQPLLLLAPHKTAATAMRCVVDSIQKGNKLVELGRLVGERLWIETMLARASKWEMITHEKIRSTYKQKMQDIRRMKATDEWTTREKVTTGVWLVMHIAELTGMIILKTAREGGRSPYVVSPSPKCIEFINDVITAGKLLCPFALPMVVPPRPWDKDLEGGYLTSIPNSKLTKDASPLGVTGNEPFIKAANLQQAVPWRVNKWVLEQLQFAWDQSLSIGRLLPREGYPIPPYPKHLPDDHEDVRQWKFNARILHEKNDKSINRRVATAKQLWIANRMASYDSIYFPTQIDFRGRYYYRPPFLNPQTNDIGRSLLLFAEGKPIATAEEASWLYIHGANMYGHSKLTWQARTDWVKQHHDQIMVAGADPWRNAVFWTGAADPWQFLSFCRTYQQFKQHGYGYVCCLPVVLDCTCSGIQHYSALLRCEEMGKLVNLASSEKPQDIYSVVLNEVLSILRVDAADGNEHAQSWLQLQPDRSLLKPVVMTVPYSAGRTSILDHVQRWAFDRTAELYGINNWKFKAGAMAAVHYLTTILCQQTYMFIGPAKEAMQWFKRLGNLAGKHEIKLQWTNPAGLPITQGYLDMKGTVITLRYLSNVSLRFTAGLEERGLDPRRMGTGLSPNVIHSLDASHMAFTTLDAFAKGITNLGGIHDCFATTPAEMAVLRDSVRNTFADLYSRDVLKGIVDQLTKQLPSDVTDSILPGPELGTLNPNTVRHSTYFIT